MSFFNTFLMAFAYIALFVGMFIIYNTFSIIIAQRMREMAMLRAVGASRRQVLRSVLLESAVIGAVASRGRPRCRRAHVLRSARRCSAPSGSQIPSGDRGHHERHRHHRLRGRHHRHDGVVGRAGRPGQPHRPHRRPAGHGDREHHHLPASHRGRAAPSSAPASSASPPASPAPAGTCSCSASVCWLATSGCSSSARHRPPGHARARDPDEGVGRHRAPGPGERQAQPRRSAATRVGADDRCRPGRVHHDPGQLDEGLDRRLPSTGHCGPTTSSTPARPARAGSARRSSRSSPPCPRSRLVSPLPLRARHGERRQHRGHGLRHLGHGGLVDFGVTAGSITDVHGDGSRSPPRRPPRWASVSATP